ncbi:MAG: glycosyltransferase family 4 protein [Burkholderiaceae bacterium]|nr:glycosyltransferase family 4 protein [Burkholderiaceae bacterium]
MKPLRVLYLHMIGPFGGASRSLFEAVRAFPPGEVEATFVTQRGTVRDFFSRIGRVIEARGLTQFDNTRYSYYRGMRWLVLLRELAYLPPTVWALRRARQLCGEVDLIHLNEFTGLLVLRLARRWFDAPPAVVHVRSVARDDARSWRTRWVNRMLARDAKAVVAIDENVRASLPRQLPVQVIHNAFTPNAAGPADVAFEGRLSALRPESFKVGFVGNLLLVKGIHEFVEAARITRDRGLDVEFIVVGDDAQPSRGLKARVLKRLGLRQNVRAEVEAALDQYVLRDRVHLAGFTADISRAYRHMDVLCFPSHYDAPGRPIFEAAFFGIPSIVAVRDPKPDTLVHGETGLAIAPRSALELADAIARMAADRGATRRMGEAARAMAQRNFDVTRNAASLLQLYRQLTSVQR